MVELIIRFLKELDIKCSKLLFIHIKCFLPSLIATIMNLIFPSFISKIIDDGIEKGNMRLAMTYWIAMLLCGGLLILFNYMESIFYCKFEQGLYLELKNKVLNKILLMKIDAKPRSSSGDLYVSVDNDLSNIASFLTTLLPGLMLNMISLIGVIGMIFKYYSAMGFLVLGLMSMLVITQPWFGKKIKNKSYLCREVGGEEATLLQESIGNAPYLNIMGYIGFILEKYSEKSKTVKSRNIEMLRTQYIAQNFRLGINTIALLMTIAIGAYLVSKNAIGVGGVFAMSIYIQRVSGPLNSIVQDYLLLQSYIPLFERITNIIESSKKKNSISEFPNKKLEKLSISDLTFSFSDTTSLYNNFNLTVNEGEIVGIVGSNGIGKSTLVKIIMKILPIEQGNITINDEYKLSDLDEKYLYKNISVVPQSVIILSGCLKDILNPSKRDIPDEKIIKTLKSFTVDFSIFDNNLNYELNEKGLNISGGEAQKISLVRMALEDKPWVILDEPTAAMDANSEKKVCETLKTYLKDRTAIIITHRPEILKICSRIIEM